MRWKIVIHAFCIVAVAVLVGCTKPSGVIPDYPIQLVGHPVPLLSDEVKEIEAEIAKVGESTTEDGQQIEVKASVVSMMAYDDEELPFDLPAVPKILSPTQHSELLARMKEKPEGSVELMKPHVLLFSGKRKVLHLTTVGTYVEGYQQKENPPSSEHGYIWIPTLGRYEPSATLFDVCALADGEEIVLKRLCVKQRTGVLIPVRARLFGMVETTVSEPVVTTVYSTLKQPCDIRIKPGECLFLPLATLLERGASNVRAIATVEDVRGAARPYHRESNHVREKSVRFALVTARALEEEQPPSGSAPEPGRSRASLSARLSDGSRILLIGPDGNLIARNLRGEGIKAAVAEALGKE